MRVFVFALYATVDTSFGTDLEIIQEHLNAGDEVKVFRCPAALPACDRNRENNPDICAVCQLKSKTGLSLLKNASKLSIEDIKPTRIPALNVEMAPYLASKEELKKWTINNFDIGYAILSSLVSWKRDKDPDFTNEEYRDFLTRLAEASLMTYNYVADLFEKEKPDVAYVFNGRYAPMRAIVRACERYQVPFYTHDRGRDLNHYKLHKNALPHNLERRTNDILTVWENADSNRDEIAGSWFMNKAKGFNGAWKSHIGKQVDGELPATWNSNIKNITVFTSSEHEFASIGKEWEQKIFESQQEGIRYILSVLKTKIDKKEAALYIRIHPNQINADYKEIKELLEFESEDVHIMMPDSTVSTYAMITESDVVVTFGSTVGIEAVYWGTPSIMLGQSLYKVLNATYNPGSKEEIKDMLASDLAPKPRELAYPFGYYMATLGQPFKYYTATGFLSGNFHNKPLLPSKTTWKILVKSKLQSVINRIFA